MENKIKKFELIILTVVFSLFIANTSFATKPLPGNYGTAIYSQNIIKQAEEKISQAENLLIQARKKDLDKLSPNDKSFIQETIKKLEDRLEEAKENLDFAKKYFKEEQYFNASSKASYSRETASIVILDTNKTLEGRTKEDWNRLETIEEKQPFIDDKQPLTSEGGVKTEEGVKTVIFIRGATESDCVGYLKECNSGNSTLCIKWETNCNSAKELIIETKLDKTVISIGGASRVDCEYYLKECKSNVPCCAKNGRQINAETREKIEVKDNKIYVNKKEIKIMPDTASQKAIETLQIKKDVKIEIKDTGKPVYEVSGGKEVKILGLFKVNMLIKTEINTENGNIEKTKKPWWNFLTF